MGIEAVETILEAKPGFQHTLIGIHGSKMIRSPLMEAVKVVRQTKRLHCGLIILSDAICGKGNSKWRVRKGHES